jgi:hypothetical protein
MAPLTSARFALVTSHVQLNSLFAAWLSAGSVSRQHGQATLPLAAHTQLRGTHGDCQCHNICGPSAGGMSCMC